MLNEVLVISCCFIAVLIGNGENGTLCAAIDTGNLWYCTAEKDVSYGFCLVFLHFADFPVTINTKKDRKRGGFVWPIRQATIGMTPCNTIVAGQAG